MRAKLFAPVMLLFLLMFVFPLSGALGNEAAGTGDPSSNMDYIDSDPDEGVMGNPLIMIEVDGYHAGYYDCWVCDELGDYACSPYGTYPGWGWPLAVGFSDPVPAGYIVTRIEATVNGLACWGDGSGLLSVYVNAFLVGSDIHAGECPCGTCNPLTVIGDTYPCGVPGYNLGGKNNLILEVDGLSCISDVHLSLVYEPLPTPLCDADGPYSAECSGATTVVALDGTGSSDPCGQPFTYLWDTDCPGGVFDDDTSPAPTLTVGSSTQCPLVCNVDLLVDNGQSSDQCSTTVTIDDTVPPDITCPGNLSLECDESTDPAFAGVATATDLCDPSPDVYYADVDAAGACAQEMTITRTWAAEDNCGNPDSCDQIITVVDTTDPVLSIPGNITIECGEPTDPSNTGVATATDNCDPAPIVTWGDTSAGTCPEVITRTWTATDACGNSDTGVQTITVDDTIPPTFTIVPADTTVECDGAGNVAQLNAWLANVDAVDTCGSVTITHDFTALSDGCGETGSAMVTWTAEDECGNQATTSATFTIVDTSGPTFTIIPTDLTIECDEDDYVGQLTAWLNSPAAEDLCGGVTITNDYIALSDGCGATGSATVTWTAEDDCGVTATTMATFTMVDTTAPTIFKPASTIVECDGEGNVAEYDAWLNSATAEDDCGDVVLSVEVVEDYGCGEDMVYAATWTAEDECLNTTTEGANFEIKDTINPVITCPPNASVTYPDPTDPSATGVATVTDECRDDLTASYGDVDTGTVQFCPTISIITRTWTATDCSGQSSCDQLIQVTVPIPEGMCCNPADGTLTPIDDGDECTADICNEETGEVTHPDNGLCNACCDIFGHDTCDDVLPEDCPNPDNYFVGQDCDYDSDGDGVADACDDCPFDPDKTEPGICGCGCSDDIDGDSDGHPECPISCCPSSGWAEGYDTCPGVDDEIYGPCGDPCDPEAMIPTVSEWGLVILAMLLLTAGKLYFGRRDEVAL
ncbi:MAG: hypothetical protein JSU63_14595 [Phycisphaerales bacterium]|nr:MAG: hypothetical protein JSU63_14595 [Phycisphaerales bacterium]